MVIAILYGSFRALAGGGEVTPEDCRVLVTRLCALATERGDELAAAIAAPPPAAGDAPPDRLTETAAALRKQVSAYLQQATGLRAAAGEAERERLDAASALLVAALEDLGWACRLTEGGRYRDNPGLQDAVAALRAHAARCLEAASGIVEVAVQPPAAGAPSPV